MKDLYKKENDVLSKAKIAIAENIDKMIAENNVKCAIESVNDKNIFELIDLFESITGRIYSYNQKDGKKAIGHYAKVIKENKELRDCYNLYNALKSKQYPKKESFVSSFISEAIKSFPNIKNIDFVNLKNVVKEGVNLAKVSMEEVDSILSENKEFRDNIEFLATKKKNSGNLYEYVKAVDSVVNHIFENISDNTEQEGIMSQEELCELLTNLGNSEEIVDEEMLNDIVECRLSGKDDSEIFNICKEKCLDKIKAAIDDESSVENKARLITIKEGLENKTYSKEAYYEDLPKMYELKNMF